MKFLLYLLTFLISANIVSSQSKYLIYFSDKGAESEKIYKSSDKAELAKLYLSDKSIKRRLKSMGEKNYFSPEDLPVSKSYLNILKENEIGIVHELKWFNAVSAYLTPAQLKTVEGLSFVSAVIPVGIILIKNKSEEISGLNKEADSNLHSSIYNIDYGPSLVQLELSAIPLIHSANITGEGVTIGVLDNGFAWRSHPAFQDLNVIAEYDFIQNDNITSNQAFDKIDQHNHGSSVLSILGGFQEGSLIGTAYNADFVLAKTEDNRSETHLEEDNYAAALEWMDSIGVDITTSSLGYSEFDNTSYSYQYIDAAGETVTVSIEGSFSYDYQDMDGKTTIITKAAEKAFERGIVVINSAGNEGDKKWKFITAPGDGINVITVGAVDSKNNLAPYSSRGPTYDGRIKPDILAQGTSVYAVNPRSGEFAYYSGTSMSAPIIAGTAGLLLSEFPHLNNRQVRGMIREAGDNSGSPDNDRGWGLISATKLLTYPNLSYNNTRYKLHKRFISSSGIVPSSVKIFVGSELNGYTDYRMDKDAEDRFTFSVPYQLEGDTVSFYFEFEDGQAQNQREPANQNYTFQYGELFIYLNTREGDEYPVPDEFELFQNYPNPFNSLTTILFELPVPSPVQIKIHNILGEQIILLADGNYKEGRYAVSFDASGFASGVYIYTLQAKDFFKSRKMLYIK